MGLYDLAVEEQLALWVQYECCPWLGATYIIYAKDVERIKIGCVREATKNKPLNILDLLRRRTRTLNSNSPVPLELLGIFHGSGFVENYLHKKYAEHRVHGEWFTAQPIIKDLTPFIKIAKRAKTCITRQVPNLLKALEEIRLAETEFEARHVTFKDAQEKIYRGDYISVDDFIKTASISAPSKKEAQRERKTKQQEAIQKLEQEKLAKRALED